LRRDSDARELCPRSPVCDDPRGVTLTERARDAARLSNVGFAVGLAGLAGAIGLTLVATSEKDTAQVAIAPTESGGQLELSTVF
jgi:hypothetical protein